MSRSYRKPYVVQSYGNKSKHWFKRQASKAVRRYKGHIPNGKAYRKWYPSWDICDYIWYEDGKPSMYLVTLGYETYEEALKNSQETRTRWSRK